MVRISSTVKKDAPTSVSFLRFYNKAKDIVLGSRYDLSIVFIGNKLSKKLNSNYRKIHKPTDVLSFTLDKTQGEIFINIPYSKIKCKQFDKNFDTYIKFIFIHGLFHLKGYEHGSKMECEGKKSMAKNLSIGIDIGTSYTRAVCLEELNENIRIAGIGQSESRGIRKGYINNIQEASKSIKLALKGLDKIFPDGKFPPICVSVGGIGLSGNIFQASTSISGREMEITQEDVFKVSESTRSDMPQAFAMNRKVVHSFPLQYKIDGKIIPGKPHGLKGSKLEARTLFITSLGHHINDLIDSINQAGFEVKDITSSLIARSNLLLSKAEKIAGVVLVDIGSETTSIIIYENNLPISLEVFDIGSNELTNEIALKLKVGLEDAEEIKRSMARTEYPRKKMDDIVQSHFSKLFNTVNEHLKKIGKAGLLPAGVILSGGGAEISQIESASKQILKLPSKRIEERVDFGRNQIKTSEWAGAYGAAMFGLSSKDEEVFGLISGINLGKKVGKNIWEMIKQFLP